MKEKIENSYNKFASIIDFVEIYLAYLKWISDNVEQDENIYYDILECFSRFSLQEQQILQFRKKIDSMLLKYQDELKDKEIDASYFKEISERIIKKVK